MARLQLITNLARTIPYYPRYGLTNQLVHAPFYRLIVQLVILPRVADSNDVLAYRDGVFEAILDTGSGFSVFHPRIWKPFEDEIRWLKRPSNADDRNVTILGGKWPFRLGQVRLAAIDPLGNWLPTAWNLALFLEDVPGVPNLNVPRTAPTPPCGLRCPRTADLVAGR